MVPYITTPDVSTCVYLLVEERLLQTVEQQPDSFVFGFFPD